MTSPGEFRDPHRQSAPRRRTLPHRQTPRTAGKRQPIAQHTNPVARNAGWRMLAGIVGLIWIIGGVTLLAQCTG
jgi:hypothetical protein